MADCEKNLVGANTVARKMILNPATVCRENALHFKKKDFRKALYTNRTGGLCSYQLLSCWWVLKNLSVILISSIRSQSCLLDVHGAILGTNKTDFHFC